MDVQMTEVAPGVHHARAKHVSWVLVVEGDLVTVVDTGFPGDRDHIGSAEHLRRTHGARVLTHEKEQANATGERIEQVSELTILRHAWRPPS